MRANKQPRLQGECNEMVEETREIPDRQRLQSLPQKLQESMTFMRSELYVLMAPRPVGQNTITYIYMYWNNTQMYNKDVSSI